MQTGISRIFPQYQPRTRRRQIHASGRGGRGGRGRGFGGRNSRGRGRGGRGYRSDYRSDNGKRKYNDKYDSTYENGVDISDKTRYYSDEEWNRLSFSTRDQIHNDPGRKRAIEERKRQRAKRGASAATVSDYNSSTNNNRSGPPNGSRAVSVARTSGSVTSGSELTYDQYGNSK